jgi:FkbM family methyltransferase
MNTYQPPLNLDLVLVDDPSINIAFLKEKYGILDRILSGQENAILYPAARMSRIAARPLRKMGVKIAAFGDSSSTLWGKQIDGITVLSPEQISTLHRHTPILSASTVYDSVIRKDLEQRGCTTVIPVGYLNYRLPDVFISREYAGAFDAVTNKANWEAINEAFSLLEDDESKMVFVSMLAYYTSFQTHLLDDIRTEGSIYFDSSVYNLSSEEIVVDAGAFIGDTWESFRLACNRHFRAYVAFEPNRNNFNKLVATVADAAGIEVVPSGLSRHSGTVRFLTSYKNVDARVLGKDESGGDEVTVVSLDDFFTDRPSPTLIKMDVEGAEADALLGATQLLVHSAPKLAISVYHYATDIWNIPLLIKRINPRYRIWLRHYSKDIDDTVCYGISD